VAGEIEQVVQRVLDFAGIVAAGGDDALHHGRVLDDADFMKTAQVFRDNPYAVWQVIVVVRMCEGNVGFHSG